MNSENYYNINQFIIDVQKEIKEFVRKRNQLNSKIKNYINSFEMTEYEIYKTLFNAREYYNKKRQFCTKEIRKLRRKHIEHEDFLDFLINERKNIEEPVLNIKLTNLIKTLKDSIRESDYKIENLNKKINNHSLEIKEEIQVVRTISKLERSTQRKFKLLSELEQTQITELHKSDYYKINSKIEQVERILKEINLHLIKWSNKRINYHKNMLNLYREARVFRKIKKKMENKLKENSDTANHNYQHFLEKMNQNEKNIMEGKWLQQKVKPQRRDIITPRLESIITRKEMFKQFKNEKLAIALEKQKLGKKLDFYELKLILERSKK